MRILRTTLWAGVAVALLATIAATVLRNQNGPQTPEAGAGELPMLFAAPPFSLVNQDGRAITDQTLRGHPYVAAFIFTHCAGPCPMMSGHMAKLQQIIASPQVRLVSFTVDPKRDTPEVLREYAARFGADQTRWFFLTGESQTVMDVVRGFLLTAQPATDGSGDILHDTRFLLVDAAGQVRGLYSSNDAAEMARLPRDAEALAAQDGAAAGSVDGKAVLAAVNASLNAISAILLVAAFMAVRRGRFRAHGWLMAAAVMVSAVFLACYLSSYYVYGERSSGLAPGRLRTAYLSVLASHVLLAAAVLPMVLVTLWQAWRRQWPRHRGIARPTYWVWVYVSMTGVIVYWMLYHLIPGMRTLAATS